MPIPSNISTGTVTGTFMNVAGDPKKGTVTFKPSFDRGLDAAQDVVFIPEKVTASLNTNGSFSVVLAATNDPDLTPLNFNYTVEIHIGGVLIPTFTMSLPAGSTVDMTDVMP